MSKTFDRQRDLLPAALTGGFRVHDIRRREHERQAAGRWPLLAAIDDHLWNRHVQRNAFRRQADPLGAFIEVDADDSHDPQDRAQGGGEVFRLGSRR